MPDAQFEKTLSDLAHAKLRDRAPGLLDYLVGFQLLDKSDDNTHAVGVWGFKVGNEWMYAPVFFLNGQLKGDELLYLKSQDAFVPMAENWINYLLNRRPHVLGELEPQKQNELGIRQPDFDVLARPPYTGSKYASAGNLRNLTDYLAATVSPEFNDFLPVIMDSPGGGKRAKLANDWNLPNFIKRAGKKTAGALLGTMRKNAEFAESVLRFYRMDDIIDAAKEAFSGESMYKQAAEGDKKIEGEAPKVQVLLDSQNNLPSVVGDITMTDEEKEKIRKDKYVVRDNRGDDQVSRVYDRQVSAALQNPHGNGYCNVLQNKGEWKKCLVIKAPNKLGGSRRPHSLEGLAVVVDFSTKMCSVCAGQDIYVDEGVHDAEGWQKIYDGLPAATSVSDGQKVVFVNEKCQGTLPFRVTRKLTTADGQIQLYGITSSQSEEHAEFDREMLFPHNHFPDWDTRNPQYQRNSHCIIVTKKPGANITQVGHDLFVPENYKAVVVKDAYGEQRPIDPQTLAEVEMKMFKTGNYASITPITDGIEWWLKLGDAQSPPMSKLAALKTLITEQGLREKDALSMLKLARRTNPPTFLVKYAAPSSPPFPEPQIATDPDIGNVPVQYPQTNLLSANEDEINAYGEPYMDMDATYHAQQAANSGQKEVLDTSIIGGLIKTMDPNSAIDGYIGDLMLGLDRVGRIIFMYYWHYEKFKERYGSQDMPELEDNLKNVFENLGDLTLFLKQKTIEPDVSNASAEAELTEVL